VPTQHIHGKIKISDNNNGDGDEQQKAELFVRKKIGHRLIEKFCTL